MTQRFYAMRPYGDKLFGRHFAFADVLPPQNVGTSTDNSVCPCCGRGMGMRPWLPPHRIKLSSSRYPDLLWGAGFDLMVSERFKRLYEASGLQGITRFDPPAEIVKVGRRPASEVQPPPPDYHNIWFLRGGADLDDDLSEARRPPGLCPCCRGGIHSLQRVVLRPGSWTGADLFKAYGLSGTFLVSERFQAFVEQHQITNAELTPAEQYHFDFGTGRRR